MTEAWALRPGMVVDVPTQGPLLVMDVRHLRRFDKVEVTFDTGLAVRMLWGSLVPTR
jgi:hypothetical protein